MQHIAFPLFLPATRLDRLGKASGSGADAVILDLEDAVSPSEKVAARDGLLTGLAPQALPLVLRVNDPTTPWHDADLLASRALPVQAVMLAKTETADSCLKVAERTGKPVIALIETALGLANARAIAEASIRLAFGSIDYAADLGIAHIEPALLHARSTLVHAARLAGQGAPLDGVTADFRNADLVSAESRHGRDMGFGGKLLIHPVQIDPARRGFAPTKAEQDWARRVLEIAGSAEGAVQLDGAMVDAPVIKRAESIMKRVPAL